VKTAAAGGLYNSPVAATRAAPLALVAAPMDLFDHLDVDTLHLIALIYWLVLAFVLGAAIGSFINVAAARLPLEKSIVWPGSRCGRCLQPVRWYDNVPLIGYLWLRGRCRSCGGRFSSVYFWVELGTALGFAGLFYCEAVRNIHGWPGTFMAMPPWPTLVGFGYHATLFSFLMAASVCDLRTREIPLPLTLSGTALGLIGAVLLAWPWPWMPAQAGPPLRPFQPPAVAWQMAGDIKQGIYPWPFWGPLPAPFAPGGNWQTGLATGLAGAMAGTFLLRGVGFLFGTGLGKEAMGLGDADLMMMVGAFLGWQVVVVAFFVSVVPALLLGAVQLAVRRDNALPFGPPLSIGAMATCLGWYLMSGSPLQMIFFNWLWMVCLLGAGAGLLLFMSFMLRVLRG
jgi:leader peptidase (prepilin peptidase) / N-methyltransferase